jgi:hypothetical protein
MNIDNNIDTFDQDNTISNNSVKLVNGNMITNSFLDLFLLILSFY